MEDLGCESFAFSTDTEASVKRKIIEENTIKVLEGSPKSIDQQLDDAMFDLDGDPTVDHDSSTKKKKQMKKLNKKVKASQLSLSENSDSTISISPVKIKIKKKANNNRQKKKVIRPVISDNEEDTLEKECSSTRKLNKKAAEKNTGKSPPIQYLSNLDSGKRKRSCSSLSDHDSGQEMIDTSTRQSRSKERRVVKQSSKHSPVTTDLMNSQSKCKNDICSPRVLNGSLPNLSRNSTDSAGSNQADGHQRVLENSNSTNKTLNRTRSKSPRMNRVSRPRRS